MAKTVEDSIIDAVRSKVFSEMDLEPIAKKMRPKMLATLEKEFESAIHMYIEDIFSAPKVDKALSKFMEEAALSMVATATKGVVKSK